jgi:hypothetical protein
MVEKTEHFIKKIKEVVINSAPAGDLCKQGFFEDKDYKECSYLHDDYGCGCKLFFGDIIDYKKNEFCLYYFYNGDTPKCLN